jgi:hypothetical protein
MTLSEVTCTYERQNDEGGISCLVDRKVNCGTMYGLVDKKWMPRLRMIHIRFEGREQLITDSRAEYVLEGYRKGTNS